MRTLTDMVGPIGERQHQVNVLTPGAASPEAGGGGGWSNTPAPATPAVWWVRIRPATVRDLERVTAGTTLTTATHVLEGAYHPGITAESTLTYGTRTFYVRGVINPEERNIATIAVCQEVLP